MTILIGKTKKILTIYTLTKNRTPETPDRIGDDWSATSALEKLKKKLKHNIANCVENWILSIDSCHAKRQQIFDLNSKN